MPYIFVYLSVYTTVVQYHSSVSACPIRIWHYNELKVFRVSWIPLRKLPRRSQSQQAFLPWQNQSTCSRDHMTHATSEHESPAFLTLTPYECYISTAVTHYTKAMVTDFQQGLVLYQLCFVTVVWCINQKCFGNVVITNSLCGQWVEIRIDSFCKVCFFGGEGVGPAVNPADQINLKENLTWIIIGRSFSALDDNSSIEASTTATSFMQPCWWGHSSASLLLDWFLYNVFFSSSCASCNLKMCGSFYLKISAAVTYHWSCVRGAILLLFDFVLMLL